jgi:hypothetical protein
VRVVGTPETAPASGDGMARADAAGTIVADFSDMQAVAAHLAALRHALDDAVAACVAASRDVVLVGSAIADPVAAARLELDLVAVRDGPSGMRWTALELAGLRDLLLLAVDAYRTADDAQSWAVRHPGVIDDAIAVITGLTGMPERRIAADLAQLWPDGRPTVRLVALPQGPQPPRTVADLMRALAVRCGISNRWSPASAAAVAALPPGYDDGTIDVRKLSGPDGTAWIVDLPGTSDWDLPGPFANPARAHDPADFGGDIRLMAGESTAYERGVVHALVTAGVGRDEPILLTGHSEGGMVAMAAAGMLAGRGFTVRSVLTAGSPIATMPRPAGTGVLALENAADVVPHLDGQPNPADDDEWSTLTFTDRVGGIGADHGFVAYDAGAQLADRSTDPKVVAWRRRARPFLSATSSTSYAFRIQRVP